MTELRLVFMGTPDFAVPTLTALLDAGHDVAAVYTRPPRPAGRGKQARRSPVQRVAAARSIPICTPASLKSAEAQAEFAAHGADAAVVVAYGLILPQAVLDAPRLGCVNLHASLLPRWRGAAPVQRAVMAGDAETGVTVMRMEAGLDTGPMLAERRVAIGPATTAGDLHDELAEIGAGLMVETLAALAAGTVTAVPQPEQGVTYAAKIDKAEARIDWQRPAAELACLVRGLSPFPGAWFEADGQRIKLHMAEVVDAASTANEGPGTVLDDRLTVACGSGGLSLTSLQRQGKGVMAAADFLRGFPLPPGTVLT